MEFLKQQLPDLDFSKEIEESPELEKFIKKECDDLAMLFKHPLEEEEAPQLDTDFGAYFLLWGLPIVDQEKKEMLLKVLANVFKKKGAEFVTQDNITILLDPSTGQSYGTAFIKCESDKQAKMASNTINNFALGKDNKILSATFDEFERLTKIPDEYIPPKFADLADLYSYAMDSQNDQFLIREDNKIKVKLNKMPNKADKNINSNDFHQELVGPSSDVKIASKHNAEWSPQGRYLIVLQENLVQLYGGSCFDLVREIFHADISYAHVSPCEKYIITFSDLADEKEGNYNFWRIDTGEILRKFPFDEVTPKGSPKNLFSFSFDGKYWAKMIQDHVVVYELPEMHVLLDERIDKRVGIKIDNITDFKWNPAKNMFWYAYFIKTSKAAKDEDSNGLPKIGFIDIPSREIWDEKEIINGDHVKIEWSADGTKLIAVCKLKKKKEYFNNVQIFDVTTRGIPTDIIKVNTNILSVEWTSATNRLAILANNSKKIKEKWEDKSQIASVTVYDIQQEKHSLISTLLGQSKEHITNNVKWANNGDIFVMSDIRNPNPVYQGKFYVYYVRKLVTRIETNNPSKGKKNKKKGKTAIEEKIGFVVDSVNEVDHPKDDWIEWDPTSRFFVTTRLPKGEWIRFNI
jgi:translation initiation factor 3 subunit B